MTPFLAAQHWVVGRDDWPAIVRLPREGRWLQYLGRQRLLGVASEVNAEVGVLMVCCSSPISGLESQRTPSWGRSLSSQVLYPECRVQILSIALASPPLLKIS